MTQNNLIQITLKLLDRLIDNSIDLFNENTNGYQSDNVIRINKLILLDIEEARKLLPKIEDEDE